MSHSEKNSVVLIVSVLCMCWDYGVRLLLLSRKPMGFGCGVHEHYCWPSPILHDGLLNVQRIQRSADEPYSSSSSYM